MTGPIVCLPGLGADHRLFAPQLAAFDSASVPDWPAASDSRSLPDLAASLRRALESRGLWSPGTTLVGFSFGAQIALTMTLAAVNESAPTPKSLVLISGLWTDRQLTPRFRRQAAAARIIPAPLMRRAAASLLAPRFARASGLDRDQTQTLRALARDLDAPEFKRLSRLAASWTFSRQDLDRVRAAGVNLLGLHAAADFVIPPPTPAPPECDILSERAHLLTWTHADPVNQLIEQAVSP